MICFTQLLNVFFSSNVFFYITIMSNDTVLSEVPYSYFINLLPMDASRFVYLTEWWQVDLNLMPKGVAFVTLVTLLNPFQASPFAFFCQTIKCMCYFAV